MLSVIMPVYNGELYLQEAIESILNQSYHDFEFIVINDGSTDNSLSIINSYMLQDSRMIVINRENRGLIASLNEGIEIAKGKYIARMDADDISLPSRFEKQMVLMETKDADICGCHWINMNMDGKTTDCVTVPLTDESLVLYLSYSVPFAHGAVMIRKSFLTSNNIYYDRNGFIYAEDYELWVKMFEHSAKFVNVNEFLFKYRQSKQSFSQVNFKKNRAEAKSIGINFVKKYTKMCILAFESLIAQELSKKEQEIIVILGFRLSVLLKTKKYFFSALKNVDKKNLPNILVKLIYIMFVD
jgi:glycosyltransferase involved in cell wall biosynthesis